MEYLLGVYVHGMAKAVECVKVDIQNTLRILNDEKATVASNEANKASMVESVRPKVTAPLHLPDIMRRWEGEIGRCIMTDERLRDIVAFDCVLFLNLQDVESIAYPSLKRDNRLSVDLKLF